jgi:hypothetical protein
MAVLVDGFVTQERGINSGRAANLLAPNQSAFAINFTFREEYPETRPAFKKLNIVEGKDHWEKLFFQDACYYDPENRMPIIGTIMEGELYTLEFMGDDVYIKSAGGDKLYENADRCWMVQAGSYLVCQDGNSTPIIYDGYSVKKAQQNQVPTGSVMAYGLRRLIVARGREYAVGDLEGVPSQGGGASVLNFTGQTGGVYLVDSDVTALAFNAVPDTSLGHGNLTIFTKDKIYSLGNLYEDPQDWQQVLSIINSGAEGAGCVSSVNSDLWYKSFDGIRSYALARRAQNTWANSPFSKEINRILEQERGDLLKYSSMVTFNGRLLITALPYSDFGRWYNECLIVLDFENTSSITERENNRPVWEGAWTGIHPIKLLRGIFNGEERCIVFAWNKIKQRNEIWEITKDGDLSLDNDKYPICSVLETRKFFSQTQFQEKRIQLGEIFLDRLSAPDNNKVIIDVKYRPDDSPCWSDWIRWCETVVTRDCNRKEYECLSVKEFKDQYRSRRRLGTPKRVCDPSTNSYSDQAYTFQARIALKGIGRIKAFRIQAEPVTMQNIGDCSLPHTKEEVC